MTATLRVPGAAAPTTAPGDRPGGGPFEGGLATALALAAACLPVLRPVGPGNTGVVDLAMIVAILVVTGWAVRGRRRLHLPYALPVGLAVMSGALAALAAATSARQVPAALALVQDLFVWIWAAAICTAGRQVRLLDVFCRAWSYSTVWWAALLLVGQVAGIDWLTGLHAGDGLRASLTLGDPNLAANYFLVGLMVMRATRRPRRALWHRLSCALVVLALLTTLSNGGILALLVATVLGALFGVARRWGGPAALTATVVVALVGAGVVGLAARADTARTVDRLAAASPYLRDSIGRHDESTGSRSTLLHEGLRLWLDGNRPLGLGPGGTQSELRARQAPYVKEAHNDYVGTLTERGPVGAAALLLLAVALGVRARRSCRPGALASAWRQVVPRPELLAAGVVAVALSGMLYEVLHFRHVWALFGVVAALALAARPGSGPPVTSRPGWDRSGSGPPVTARPAASRAAGSLP